MNDTSYLSGKRLLIQDSSLRDGHQSLLATRMRTEDMIPVAEKMDAIGFWAMEVWGGATFDTMHRFLKEDPWERPRILKKYIRKTPLSMLLRGQNLVGYRNYPDDVVRSFVDKSCEVGIDVFRVFDALNDLRNFETAVDRIKGNGKIFEGAICYSLTERHMGGDVFNLQYYVGKCKELEAMGADTICIKDMAGLMAPYDAYELIKILKREIRVPLHLHTHCTSGMAPLTYLKAIEAGVDIIDTCLAPLANGTSQPAVEPFIVALGGTPRDTKLDLNSVIEADDHFEHVIPKYRKFIVEDRVADIDVRVLEHQIPGGMISNLKNQLQEAHALDRLPELWMEIPRVRRELGMPPLVTPTSQIVGAQAVLNVLSGRYRIISNQLRDLVFGLYGKTPVPVDPEIQQIVLKGHHGGSTPVTGRSADYIPAELERNRKEIGSLAKTEEDLLTYSLYPSTGQRFLKEKYKKNRSPVT
ncbi:MAG TPA: pyruvate carboxylase subunit B [Syntrophales bacterium]|nr:pyruvate carboxylase subunit B [Syntrophales bacterium]HPQ43209.1 pyruvate carboxylase subunit B [Syntrophales bacterium]